MTMREAHKAIYDRTHKPENREKYDKLILHTSEVEGGEKFLCDYDRAKDILDQCPKMEQPDSSCLATELSALLKKLNKWLDENGWL